MLEFIRNNMGTIIVSAVLLLVITAILINFIKNKKKGKSIICDCGSCGGCEGGSCPYSTGQDNNPESNKN